MISISKEFELVGQAPFQYAFTSNSSNITFSSSAGTITGNRLSVDIFFQSEADIDGARINLQVTSACNNTASYEFTLSNPCDELILSNITQQVEGDEYRFRVIVAGSSCASLNYNWSYGDLELINTINTLQYSEIRVRRSATVGLSQQIQVTVTDPCTGCIKVQSIVLSACQPEALDVTYNFNRDKDGSFVAVTQILPDPIGCPDFIPDWSTVQVDLPTGFTYSITGNQLTITPPASSQGGSYVGTYFVSGTNGVLSTPGQILINVQDAAGAGDTIYIPNQVTHLDCDVSPGDVVSIPIENIVVQDGVTVDWDTFEVLSSPTPLGTINPTVQFGPTLGMGGGLSAFILYTVPAGFSQDSFAWTVADTDGNYARSAVYTLRECTPSPIANDDSYTVACGTTTNLNVVSNDSANGGDPISGIVITQGPSVGSYSISGSTINYSAPNTYSGTVTILYQARSTTGELSNEATITITIICAGDTRTLTHCE